MQAAEIIAWTGGAVGVLGALGSFIATIRGNRTLNRVEVKGDATHVLVDGVHTAALATSAARAETIAEMKPTRANIREAAFAAAVVPPSPDMADPAVRAAKITELEKVLADLRGDVAPPAGVG